VGFTGLRARCRQAVEEQDDSSEREISTGIFRAEEIGGHVPKVTVLAIGRGEVWTGITRELGDDVCHDGAAHAERALVMRGKRMRGQEAGGERSIGKR